MKKRTILALLITIICVIATNKYWLVFRPIQVGFNIQGQGNAKVEVLLNKKDNNDFKKVRSATTSINLDSSNNIDLCINRARTPKRLKIAIIAEQTSGGGQNPHSERI